MLSSFRSFLRGEDGAIVVDWVVLTGSCVGLGLGAVLLFSGSLGDNSVETAALMNAYEIDDEFDTPEQFSALLDAANDDGADVVID